MALTVGELQVMLSGDTKKLDRDLDRIDNRAGDTERKHSAAWGRIGSAIGVAVKAGAVVATGAVAGLGVAIAKGIDLVSFQQQAQISFATLLGGADKARAYLAELTQFAAKTPFELPGVVQAAQQLVGVGRSAESVIPTLEAWGNASGALGQTQEQFGRTMTAVTQMIGKGKVSAEEMLQITEAGIPIWGLLAEATGKPIPELQKLASEGKLLADDVLPALEAQMQKKYGGAMEAQAKTLSGVWSTFKDNLNLALADGVRPLAEGLTAVLPAASEKAGAAIRTLAQRGTDGLLILIEKGQQLHEEFGPEMGQLADMAKEKWGQFTTTLGRMADKVGPSLPSIADALVRILQVGVDVGEDMLPALNAGIDAAGPVAEAAAGALGLIAGALETIEPILPTVVTGFLAFRGISAVNGLLTSFHGGLGNVSSRLSDAAINAGVFTEKFTGSAGAGERVMTGVGKASTAVANLGRALPVAGIAVAGLGYVMEQNARKTEDWAQALLDGGAAAEKAMQDAADPSYWEKFQYNLTNWFNTEDVGTARTREMRDAARELHEAMSPLEQAQQRVTYATNELSQAQAQYGTDSLQARSAAETLRLAQESLEGKQRDLEQATRGASGAIAEQAQQAIAAANADLGYQSSLMSTTEAIKQYTTGITDGTIAADQRAQQEAALAQQITSTVQAAGMAAAQTHANSSESERNAAVVRAQRDAFNQLTGQLGYVPPALQGVASSLNNAGNEAAMSAEQMRGLGLSVTQIPGTRFVRIDAPTEDQRRRLQDLGYVVTTLPNGQVVVSANTGPAEDELAALTSRRYTITVAVNAAAGAAAGALDRLGFGGGRASGGPVSRSVPYLVGEEGMELFVPNASGTIIDAKKTAALLSQMGNSRASAMLPASTPVLAGAGRAASTGTGSVTVGGVAGDKHYHLHAVTRQEISSREFVNLQREAEALYG